MRYKNNLFHYYYETIPNIIHNIPKNRLKSINSKLVLI